MQQLPNDACNDRYSPSFKRHARQHIEQDSAEKRPARDVRQIDKLENAGNKARRRDEHEEEPEDVADDAERETRLKGRWRWLWKLYYAVV